MGISPTNNGHYRQDTLNPTLHNHRCMDSSSCHCPLPNQHGKKVCGSKRQLDTCTCREEPRLTQETPPTYISYVPQQPGPLTRSASHVSLVVAAEPTIVAPSRSDEGTFKLSTFNTTKNPRRTLPTSTLPEYLPGNSDGSLNNRTKY